MQICECADIRICKYANVRIYGYADISIVLLDLDQNGRKRRDIGKRRVDGPYASER